MALIPFSAKARLLFLDVLTSFRLGENGPHVVLGRIMLPGTVANRGGMEN